MKSNLKRFSKKNLKRLHDAVTFAINWDDDQKGRKKYLDLNPKKETDYLRRFAKKLDKLITKK